MTLPRFSFWTLAALTGFTLSTASAQDPTFPKKPDHGLVNDARDYPRTIQKGDWPKIQSQMQGVAKFYADFITHPLVYRIIQDPSKLPKGVDANNYSIDYQIAELNRLILETNPAAKIASDDPTPKVNIDHVDYIREMGAALDAALKPLILENPNPAVRINAARMYASICRSGAAAHWPTVTAILKNENIPTEVKFYILQAAANLLSAYDPADYRSRRHSIGSKQPRDAADKEIGALVKAVEDCVLNPNLIVPGILDGKIENATPDQKDVIGYVRRQAVKALGQVRFVMLPGPEGKEKPLYPAHTLARVCMSDPVFVPAPTPAECAEAVIGLCNMAPWWDGAPVKAFNHDAAAEAVTTALINFAGKRAADPLDRSIPWRGYSIRLNEGFKTWRGLFDLLYDPGQPNKPLGPPPVVIGDLITRTQAALLTPIEKVDSMGKPYLSAQVNVGAMREYLKGLQAKPNRTGLLFDGVKQTALPAPPKQ